MKFNPNSLQRAGQTKRISTKNWWCRLLCFCKGIRWNPLYLDTKLKTWLLNDLWNLKTGIWFFGATMNTNYMNRTLQRNPWTMLISPNSDLWTSIFHFKRGDVWFGGLHSPYRKCAKNKKFLFPNKNYWKIDIYENH